MAMGETALESASDIDAICARYEDRPDALIEILIDVQDVYGAIADAHVRQIAGRLNLSRAEVHGVRSFYSDFPVEPNAAPCVKICRAEACQAVGGDDLARDAETALTEAHIKPVYCLGNCALAPAAMVQDRLIGRASVDRIRAALKDSDHG